MKTNARKQALLRKYLNDEASIEELEELFDYLNTEDDGSYTGIMDDLWAKLSGERILKDKNAEDVLERIMRTSASSRLPSRKPLRWIPLAATILVLVAGVGSKYLIGRRDAPLPSDPKEIADNTTEDIKPGGRRAMLQAGTEHIVLSKRDTSFVLAGNTVHIDGGDVTVARVKPVEYTLTTPRGGEYSLVLADGTKVWLNADSKLTYPSIFGGKTREVTLRGEAYFDVKDDASHPFIVHTAQQSIRVLGTAFNVKAYDEEARCMTTLVNGKVQVNSFGKKMLLAPGQQAVSNNQGQFLRQEAGIHKVTAWKDGYFWFDNTGLHEIMRQLSRWYDIDVNYEEGVQPHQFMAIVSRNNDISEILGLLEGTGAVHFRIAGNNVTVLNGKH